MPKAASSPPANKTGTDGLKTTVKLVDPATQADKIKEAVDAAKNSDVAIVVVGENEATNREAWSENHLGDRDSLDLLGAQNDLVKAVVETGTPTVVLLINGRPLSINYIAEHVPAILEGWYLGQEGGTAAANVLFGDVNPGGKLPITFPHSVGDLPDFYNHKPSANRSYAFSTRKPLYAFGYGLSYTTFKFDNLRVEPAQIQTGGTAKVSVDVTNTGSREGDEVPQLYIHQKIASVTRPVMQLAAFQRTTLKPGEKKTVEFTITPDMLSLLNADMHQVVEPGIFEIMVGPEFRPDHHGSPHRDRLERRERNASATSAAGRIGIRRGQHLRRHENLGQLRILDFHQRCGKWRQIHGIDAGGRRRCKWFERRVARHG